MRNPILAAAACTLFASAGASAQTFKFTTLDNPADPTFNQLLGINDDGTIVGYFGSGAIGHPNIGYEISPPYTEYVSRNQPASLQTQATGINNAGMVTGFWSDTNNGMDNNFAVLFEPIVSRLASISVVDPLVAINQVNQNAPAWVSQALGINNEDVVAGFYLDGSGNSHGYTYALKTAAYTPVIVGGGSPDAATGINDNGQVSGFYVNSKGQTVGFVKNTTGGVVTSFHVPGTSFTQLLGINNSGVAVGFYQDKNNVPHGLYYTPATGLDSGQRPNGVQGTVVNGINNDNQLVGFYIDAAGNFHGMIVTVTP